MQAVWPDRRNYELSIHKGQFEYTDEGLIYSELPKSPQMEILHLISVSCVRRMIHSECASS